MDLVITTSEDDLDVTAIRDALEAAGFFVGDISVVQRRP